MQVHICESGLKLDNFIFSNEKYEKLIKQLDKPGLFTILASSPYDTTFPGPIFFAKAIQTLS
jgi:hypothetical protein